MGSKTCGDEYRVHRRGATLPTKLCLDASARIRDTTNRQRTNVSASTRSEPVISKYALAGESGRVVRTKTAWATYKTGGCRLTSPTKIERQLEKPMFQKRRQSLNEPVSVRTVKHDIRNRIGGRRGRREEDRLIMATLSLWPSPCFSPGDQKQTGRQKQQLRNPHQPCPFLQSQPFRPAASRPIARLPVTLLYGQRARTKATAFAKQVAALFTLLKVASHHPGFVSLLAAPA